MDRKDLKPTLLIALLVFLISAPAPDSETIMEATQNFIVPSADYSLQASELAGAVTTDEETEPAYQ